MRTRSLFFGAAFAALACMPASAGEKPVVEIAFVLDTTGSMSGLIEGAKRKIWSIATSILDVHPDAEIRMGLVAYRDIGDSFVTRRFDLTADIQGLYGNLLALSAGGGGDWPESVNEALSEAVDKLTWTQGDVAKKLIFLVGDAPPHMDYQQDVKWPETVALAQSRGIRVNAVQAGAARDTERVWRSIAQTGGGDYLPIPQDGGEVVIIETPFDDEIIILQRELNGTVIPYGDERRKADVESKLRRTEAAPAPAASDMATYMARKEGGRSVLTGEGDLVADVAAGRARLDEVAPASLPEPLRQMSAEERRKHIESQAAKRAEVAGKLAELTRQRDAFVRAKRSEPGAASPKGGSFDRAVEATIQKQVK